MAGKSRVARRQWLLSQAATDPTGTADLELALWSTEVTGADGSAVSAWPDTSGKGRNGAQSNATLRPVLRLTGANISPNGKRTVQFDGSGDQITGSFPGGGIANTSGYTFYLYLKNVGVAQADGQLAFASTGLEIMNQSHTFAGYSANFQYAASGHSDGPASGEGVLFGAAVTGFQMLTVRFNPPAGNSSFVDAIQMWKNGVALTPDNATRRWNITMATSWLLSGNAIQNSAMEAAVGAVLVYSTAHSNSLRASIESYVTGFFES